MIYNEIDRIQNQIIYISLILFIFGVIAAYFFAIHILEPLLKIVKASKEITFGNLKTRAPVISKDEIGTLAESFNEMVDKLDESQEELERRVEERTKELKTALISLKKAKEEAEKSDQLKTEFLGQMSHEIRTPVNVFLNFASLVKYEIEKRKNKEFESEYDVMVTASERLIRTIDLMLNFSEVQSNSYVCSNKQIDIYNEILKVLVEEYSETAAEKGLDIILIERKVTEYIYADKFTVTEIFRNLIENGIKYTKEGKVELILKSHKNNKLSITVADTGIGIAEEYMECIFEPFRQEEQGYTRKYDGNGLGLALVKKYCDLNKADLNVQSKKGKGTKIIVTFNKDA
jgi:signal transduction histidine kinase